MGTFNKLKRSRKSSHLDEKIKFLNKELKKTGVVCEAAPANSTAGIYNIIDFTEGLPEIISDVPDSTGFTAGTSTQDANGGDESTSSTWDTGWNNVSDMQNSNDLNGESNRNIPFTPDLSGWNGTSTSANAAVIFGGTRSEGQTQPTTASGIAVYSGDQGQTCIGSVGAGNKFVQILVGDAVFGSYAYPGTRSGYYGSYSESEFAAAQNIASAYEANKNKGSVSRKVWVPFNTANNGVGYAAYSGAKKTTTLTTSTFPDGFPQQWALKDVNFLTGQRQQYISQNSTPDTSTVIFSTGLDDGEYYPGPMSGFMDFLRGALDVGQKALDWLLDTASPVAQVRNAIDAFTDLHPELRYAKDIADSILSGAPVKYTPTQGEINGLADNFDVSSIGQTTEINSEPQNYSDTNFWVDDNNDVHQHDADSILDHPNNTSPSSGGSSFANPLGAAGQAQYQIVVPDDGSEPYLRYTDYAYHNLDSLDAGEVSYEPAEILASLVNAAANLIFNRNDGDPNTGAMSDYNDSIRGVRITGPIDIPISQLGTTSTGSSVYDVLYNNGWDVRNEKYEPKGKVIKEGWESPKHTYIDKNQQKRWFKEKDVAPIYPKKAPPKLVRGYHPDMLPKLDTPIPQIKVKAKDLIRSYKLKKVEAQEWIYKIERLNDYIARNPDMLAYARERYPKSDPHLAALNYKMDMQLAAADEYIEKQFPENIRLYNKLMSATKRSIKLTDPKTFKSEKGVFTTFNKLARVQHVDTVYQPKERTLKLKKRTKNSVNRFLFKPKEKTKDDILKDKLAVLDKEMQKTMPDKV